MPDNDKRLEEIRSELHGGYLDTLSGAHETIEELLASIDTLRAEAKALESRAVHAEHSTGIREAAWQAEKDKVEEARAEAKAVKGRVLAFICAACGGIGYTEAESIDCGTTLTCDCGGKTVINLQTLDEYCNLIGLRAEAKAARNDAAKQELIAAFYLEGINVSQQLCDAAKEMYAAFPREAPAAFNIPGYLVTNLEKAIEIDNELRKGLPMDTGGQ